MLYNRGPRVYLQPTLSSLLLYLSLPPCLSSLALQSNRITVLEGLDELVSLEELYISDNGIEEIGGLDNLVGGCEDVSIVTTDVKMCL